MILTTDKEVCTGTGEEARTSDLPDREVYISPGVRKISGFDSVFYKGRYLHGKVIQVPRVVVLAIRESGFKVIFLERARDNLSKWRLVGNLLVHVEIYVGTIMENLVGSLFTN